MLGTLYARVPLSPDQFAIRYVAWQVNSGQPLYSGVVDMNWPGMVALMRPIASLPFDPWFPWRMLDFAVMLGGVAATAGWLRQVSGVLAGRVWWLGYPLLYTSPALYWFAGQPDAVMTHVTLVAIALHIRAWRRFRVDAMHGLVCLALSVGVGVIMGIATLMKPLAICFALALTIHAALSARSLARPWRAWGFYVISAALGGLAALSLGFSVVILAGTPTTDAWWAAWTYNRTAQFVGGVGSAQLTLIALDWLSSYWHVGAIFIAAALILNSSDRQSDTDSNPSYPRLLLSLLLIAGFASYGLQSKGFAYHLAPSWTILTMMFCIGIANACCIARRFSSPLVLSLSIGFTAGFLCLKAGQLIPGAQAWAFEGQRAAYLERFEAGDRTSYAKLQQIDAELSVQFASHTYERPLLVWGETISLNLKQGRVQPTPYYYFLSLTNLRPDMPMHDAWLERFSSAMNTEPRAEIGVISQEALDIAERSGNAAYGVVTAWINEAETVASFGNLRIMRWRGAPSRPETDLAPARGPADADAADADEP